MSAIPIARDPTFDLIEVTEGGFATMTSALVTLANHAEAADKSAAQEQRWNRRTTLVGLVLAFVAAMASVVAAVATLVG